MNVNVIASLVDFLQNHETANIPGLGSFHLEWVRRKFVLEDHVVKPPRKSIQFSSFQTETDTFVQFIAERWNLSEDQAGDVLSEFGERVVESTLAKGQFNIQGIGTFTRHLNEQLKFQPDDRNLHLKYFDLPDLTLVPVGIGGTGEAATIGGSLQNGIQKVFQTDRNTGSNQWLIGIISLIAFIVILILTLRGCDNSISRNYHTALGFSNGLVDENSVTPSEEINPVTSYYDSLAEVNPNIGKYREVLTDDILKVGCVIIVGSFQNPKNAVLMKDRIIREGHQPYTEMYGEFTRVGILFECGEEDLVNYIKFIRGRYDAKSWYLIPEFDVPFGR